MRISDWSSDVCSSDLETDRCPLGLAGFLGIGAVVDDSPIASFGQHGQIIRRDLRRDRDAVIKAANLHSCSFHSPNHPGEGRGPVTRSEEHTSELQSLMRISYAVFCLKNRNIHHHTTTHS